jgi:hypothetical protein
VRAFKSGAVELAAAGLVVVWLIGSGLAAYLTSLAADASRPSSASESLTASAAAVPTTTPQPVGRWEGLTWTQATPLASCADSTRRAVVARATGIALQVCLDSTTPTPDQVKARCVAVIQQASGPGACAFEDRTGAVLSGDAGPLTVIFVDRRCITGTHAEQNGGGLYANGGNVQGCRHAS